MKQVLLTVVGIAAMPTPDGKYYMTAMPANPADSIINPKNRYGFSYDQLASVASTMGVNNVETLISVINKGGCKATIPATLRKVGDTYTDNFGVERKYGYNIDGSIKPDAKDWWETEVISTTFEFSDVAADFLSNLELATLTALNTSDVQANRARADVRRQQATARMAAMGGRTVIRIGTAEATGDGADVVDTEAKDVTNADETAKVDEATRKTGK